PEGYKSYSRGKPLRIEEFDLEKKWWKKRTQNEYAWKVSIKEIEDKNFNLDFKNPHFVDKIHRDPDEMIAEYEEQLLNIKFTRNSIKEELRKSNDAGLLIKYFESLYTTSDSIMKLKNVILKLAITGKLIPNKNLDQDINVSINLGHDKLK